METYFILDDMLSNDFKIEHIRTLLTHFVMTTILNEITLKKLWKDPKTSH